MNITRLRSALELEILRRRRLGWYRFVVLVFLTGASPADAQDSRLLSLGRHLARECVSCHGSENASSKGVPAINGLPVDALVNAMGAYKSGTRTNPVMVSVARSLSDEEVCSFSSLAAR